MTGKRLLAVTSRVPFSTTEEAFVQEELETMLAQGVDLLVVPIRLAEKAPNERAVSSGLIGRVRAETLLSPRVLGDALRTLVRHPRRSLGAVASALAASGGRRNLATNLLVVPKALWLAELARREGVDHLHAYWYAHTSTAAMIASAITGIPWSATGYRWDIDAENALRLKSRSAQFLRVADELGETQMMQKLRAWGSATPVPLVRTGVGMPDAAELARRPVDLTTLCCAGAFVPKKGHSILLDAVERLVGEGRDVTLHLMGDGPLRQAIEADVAARRLADRVVFHGIVPLGELRSFLMDNRPVFVLPSIRADDGQEEGIPVVLIEAMANGCPVVSTRTGSIPTLILDGCGVLVADRDPEALRRGIEGVLDDPDGTQAMTERARKRVEAEFAREASARRIADLMGTDPRS